METETLVKNAQKHVSKGLEISKKLELAEYLNKPCKRLEAAAKANTAKEVECLEELARREHGGESIDYSGFQAVADLVGETIEEMKLYGEL